MENSSGLECAEQNIYNSAGAAEQIREVPPHDSRANSPGRPGVPGYLLSSNLTHYQASEGFTRDECLERAESIVDDLRIALDNV